MRIFLTGGTGFIGSAVTLELVNAGHQVLGLARSDKGAASLAAVGADVHRGSLEDLHSLRSGAANSDGVIHTAFIHDFSNYAAAAQADTRAIETLGNALAGSGRPFIITSGTLLLRRQGPLAMEKDEWDPNFPRKSEAAGLALASHGVRASVVRLPPSVHGDGDHGFVPRLFPFRDIAQVIGRRLNVPLVSKSPEEAPDHFGWISHFVSIDCPASSAQTQEQLGWRPTHASLIADIDRATYFEAGTDAAPAAGGRCTCKAH